MQRQQISAAELATAEPGSISGPVELEGWLVFESGTETAWIAASHESVDEPVVALVDSDKIYDRMMNSRVSPLGGGPYTFVNRARLIGVLEATGNAYSIIDVDEVNVYEMVRFRFGSEVPQLKKKSP